MKYIKAYCEGNLLQYTLDEPLVMNNVNVYQFRLDTTNFSEPYNTEWKKALEKEPLGRQASFKNSLASYESTRPLIEEIVDGKRFFSCAVPYDQLLCDGRLQICVQFFQPPENQGEPPLFVYNTAKLANPPKIYPSANFSTQIKVQEDNLLNQLLNNLSGGRKNDIFVKNSNDAYDFNWVSTVPGTLIYGGEGNFTSEGFKVTLTSLAKDKLIQTEAIDKDDIYAIINPNKPELYEGFQFICRTNGIFEYSVIIDGEAVAEKLEVSIGDQLISNGLTWSLMPAIQTGIDDILIEKMDQAPEGYTNSLPGYSIRLGNEYGLINLASFGSQKEKLETPEDLAEAFQYIREKLLNIYSREEVYSKEETYSKEEVYSKEESRLICDSIITESEIDRLYGKIDNLMVYAETVSF